MLLVLGTVVAAVTGTIVVALGRLRRLTSTMHLVHDGPLVVRSTDKCWSCDEADPVNVESGLCDGCTDQLGRSS